MERKLNCPICAGKITLFSINKPFIFTHFYNKYLQGEINQRELCSQKFDANLFLKLSYSEEVKEDLSQLNSNPEFASRIVERLEKEKMRQANSGNDREFFNKLARHNPHAAQQLLQQQEEMNRQISDLNEARRVLALEEESCFLSKQFNPWNTDKEDLSDNKRIIAVAFALFIAIGAFSAHKYEKISLLQRKFFFISAASFGVAALTGKRGYIGTGVTLFSGASYARSTG